LPDDVVVEQLDVEQVASVMIGPSNGSGRNFLPQQTVRATRSVCGQGYGRRPTDID
jgi:hypothetical protein